MLSKFIESLNVHFSSSIMREIMEPVSFDGMADEHNLLVMINKGNFKVDEIDHYLQEGSFYFIPAGKAIHLKLGNGPYVKLNSAPIKAEDERTPYFRTVSTKEKTQGIEQLITVLAFDVALYNVIPFFEALDIPSFQIPPDDELGFLLNHLVVEQECNKLGREKIVSNYLEEIMIHLCRFIESKKVYHKYIDKLDFLADRRLIDIVSYIHDNLEKDLSNKTVANVAFISEDYVGQYFKALTGKNLQDYIENQRLEKALSLIKTMPDNIQEIAAKVGFKDPAYFSRRFKMKFGSNANSIRQHKVELLQVESN